MRDDDRVHLAHMIDASEAIERFMDGRARTDLDTDRMLLFAVVHAIEVIGEAAARVSDETRRLAPNIPWTAIVGMRNRLIHGYFDIDTSIVWKTVSVGIPALLAKRSSVTVPCRLLARRKQADHIGAACGTEIAVERDHATAISTREAEEISVGELLPCFRRSHLRHDRWRDGIRPERMVTSICSEHQQLIGGTLGRPRAAAELSADTNDTELGHSARRPTVFNRFSCVPVQRDVVVFVLGDDQGDEHVDIEQADHAGRYSPSARRSTSSTVRVGAPGRRGNTGTPRSKRTSASAMRRRSASTNASTGCPVWLARFASRSFSAASTVIVAFGIRLLSHVTARYARVPHKRPQIRPRAFENGAISRRFNVYGSLDSVPWAQGAVGSNPVV